MIDRSPNSRNHEATRLCILHSHPTASTLQEEDKNEQLDYSFIHGRKFSARDIKDSHDPNPLHRIRRRGLENA
ncbi:uncharacterized protein BDZ99DRAFT_25981 [Mytilinidion resinicola]|uniref:Uncharacterized protein n=1 Tax=Mytilinidion resinicola TaxID=574789 RepID=A0A6A6YK96_9PEZI|nr:uncharacterized protein BDZ99DRAFT_25981 [Mytilinidion resinicola]KAF2809282.1 hypothetical protein BDZ99DRAFT_25981 [Mytilinidion resinicola]